MVKDKTQFTFWVDPAVRKQIAEEYQEDNCQSQSEFIEKAVRFYLGYLHTKRASDFLPRVMSEVLEGSFAIAKSKLGRMLFRQAVDLNIVYHILAFDTDIDLEQLERLRYRSVRDVQELNGEISFEQALKFQKSI